MRARMIRVSIHGIYLIGPCVPEASTYTSTPFQARAAFWDSNAAKALGHQASTSRTAFRRHSNKCEISVGGASTSLTKRKQMGGYQNYGPFLGPYVIRHLVFRGPKKGP